MKESTIAIVQTRALLGARGVWLYEDYRQVQPGDRWISDQGNEAVVMHVTCEHILSMSISGGPLCKPEGLMYFGRGRLVCRAQRPMEKEEFVEFMRALEKEGDSEE